MADSKGSDKINLYINGKLASGVTDLKWSASDLSLEMLSTDLNELIRWLNEAVDNEEYERAAYLRDLINKEKNKNK